jgi:hypothetical protein
LVQTGGNRSTRRKPQTCHKSLTNFNTWCYIKICSISYKIFRWKVQAQARVAWNYTISLLFFCLQIKKNSTYFPLSNMLLSIFIPSCGNSSLHVPSLYSYRASTTLKSEGEVTSLSCADKREVRDNRQKWWEYMEKSKYFSNNTA